MNLTVEKNTLERTTEVSKKPAPRLCKAGVTLRDQINKKFPSRDKRSDGWIGDMAHQARKSDHNPDVNGVVFAIDVDENFGPRKWAPTPPAALRLANELAAYAKSGKPGSDRIKYVVYNDKIASGTYKDYFWVFRGKGYGHTQHIHVSFNASADKNSAPFPLPVLRGTF